ncbi:MAG: hypothetical protein CMH46_06455 [Muricauda sp.]|nr:hypothetical protein [Allomuricauda sp.]|tara:strand:- start:4568 stop:4828 length:261 start_codon:yes stop_codon:yes gene_type:complete
MISLFEQNYIGLKHLTQFWEDNFKLHLIYRVLHWKPHIGAMANNGMGSAGFPVLACQVTVRFERGRMFETHHVPAISHTKLGSTSF